MNTDKLNILTDLNDAQREAVLATEGPLLMLAGAGSGKTKTLTHRIAYLVSERGVPPTSILAMTFTNKAAGEMRERILSLLGRDSNSRMFPFMGTFHSVAVRILRREAAELGYPANFLIYDDSDSQAVIKSILRRLQIDEKVFTPRSIGSLISTAKNELIEPSEYVQLSHGQVQAIAAQIYPEYQKELKKAGAMDFDDLIGQLVRLFRTNKELLAEYQKRFAYIMVDEYQDTNTAQYELVHLLAAAHKNICVVGDDWQSIYSWRGANYRNILNFERDYPNATVIRLEENYRSTQNILDAAHHVITKNTARSDKNLFTKLGKGQKVFIEQLTNEMAEGQFIIQTVERLIRENRDLSLSDFAVLYRVNAQSRPLEESFLRHNLSYRIVGGVRFYERREIKDALCYLRFISQPNDTVSFSRIINLPPRGLGDKSLSKLYDYIARNELTLLDGLAQADKIEGLSAKALKSSTDFSELVVATQAEMERLNPRELLEFILKRSGYLQWLDDGSILAAERVENIKELVSVAKLYDTVGVEDFLAEIALLSDIDNTRFDNEAVTLMTMHAAKGLEFKCVFIVGMEEGLFPHSNSAFDAEQLEEERRLCYVGMTRAKQFLFLLNASSRLIYGGVQHNQPSRFLVDIPAELTQSRLGLGSASFGLPSIGNVSAPRDVTELSQEVVETIELNVGDQVSHEIFGQGIVTKIDGDEAEIAFANIGQKRLNLQFAPLTKQN